MAVPPNRTEPRFSSTFEPLYDFRNPARRGPPASTISAAAAPSANCPIFDDLLFSGRLDLAIIRWRDTGKNAGTDIVLGSRFRQEADPPEDFPVTHLPA